MKSFIYEIISRNFIILTIASAFLLGYWIIYEKTEKYTNDIVAKNESIKILKDITNKYISDPQENLRIKIHIDAISEYLNKKIIKTTKITNEETKEYIEKLKKVNYCFNTLADINQEEINNKEIDNIINKIKNIYEKVLKTKISEKLNNKKGGNYEK